MQRVGLDDQIKQAKKDNYTNDYFNYMQLGDMAGAMRSLGQLAGVDKEGTATYLATIPTYKELFNLEQNRINAATANEWKKQSENKKYAFMDKQQHEKFAHDIDKLVKQGQIDAAKEKLKSALKSDELRRQFEIEFEQVASVYGKENAAKLMANKIAHISNNPSGNSKSSKSGAVGGADNPFGEVMKASDIKAYYELAEQFDGNPENEGKPNPYREALAQNERAIHDRENNNFIIPVNEINNSDQAYHNASVVIDWAREGRLSSSRPTKQAVYEWIKQVTGDYAPAIIEQYENDPSVLADFE